MREQAPARLLHNALMAGSEGRNDRNIGVDRNRNGEARRRKIRLSRDVVIIPERHEQLLILGLGE